MTFATVCTSMLWLNWGISSRNKSLICLWLWIQTLCWWLDTLRWWACLLGVLGISLCFCMNHITRITKWMRTMRIQHPSREQGINLSWIQNSNARFRIGFDYLTMWHLMQLRPFYLMRRLVIKLRLTFFMSQVGLIRTVDHGSAMWRERNGLLLC